MFASLAEKEKYYKTVLELKKEEQIYQKSQNVLRKEDSIIYENIYEEDIKIID